LTTINAETAEPAEIYLVRESREFCVECRIVGFEMSSTLQHGSTARCFWRV